jgi:peptidoglycan/LPS O-acetylase OafA/YrhL
MKYRKEIDGLRAFAVLPVILFHAGFTTFSGGFVGVDIFFVISGYLITTIIVDEIEKGTFSLHNFYERRALRILPALFFVMLCTLSFAWFWMLPQDLKVFSESLMAVPIFASNILFWKTSGYFDTASELNPLLHTWSLAVEEQYYVLFPLILMMTWKLGKKWIIQFLTSATFAGIFAAQWGTKTHPAFTFYLLPTRGFEILIGALISLCLNYKSNIASVSQSLNQLASLAGLVFVLYAIFYFDRKTPSPSLYTLIPTIGAGLIIVFSNSKNIVGKLLGGKLFVGLGLISYSTYLWHQPLLAFARLRNIYMPSSILLGSLVIISIMLGYLSWRYIEIPFRRNKLLVRNQVFLYGLVGSLFFVLVGFLGYVGNGFHNRFSADEQVLLKLSEQDYKKTLPVYSLRKCLIDYDQNYQDLIDNKCVSKNKGIKKLLYLVTRRRPI